MTPNVTLPSTVRRPGARFRLILIVSVIGVTLVTVLAVNWLTQTTVTIDVSGHQWRVHTRADTVQDVLDEANVLLDPEDVIHPALDTHLRDGMTITVSKASAVAVDAGGDVRHVRTQKANPIDILAEQKLPVGPHDVLMIDGRNIPFDALDDQVWDSAPNTIRVIHSVTITVIDGAHTRLIHTTQADVGRALDSAGFTLFLADRVSPVLSTPVNDGLVVTIRRSQPLVVTVDGKRLATRAAGDTVGEALAAIGIAPTGQDYTIPPMDAPLEPDADIRLIRVTETIVTETIDVPFTTFYYPDPTLAAGERHIIREGVDGQQQHTIRVRMEDGQVASRTVITEQTLKAPVPRLIAYGLQAQPARTHTSRP
ncbi:MAG: DUF348 domain-containing protein [Anaerolineae bacterium]|nr:DUF348 domain-containing protein [Anaerolineae bacterium]